MSDNRYRDDSGYANRSTSGDSSSSSRTGGGYRSGSSYTGTSYDRRYTPSSSGYERRGSTSSTGGGSYTRTGSSSSYGSRSAASYTRSGSSSYTRNGESSYTRSGESSYTRGSSSSYTRSGSTNTRTGSAASGRSAASQRPAARSGGNGGSGQPPRKKRKRRIRPMAIVIRVVLVLAALLILFGIFKLFAMIGGKLSGGKDKQNEVSTESMVEETSEYETEAAKTVTPFTMAFAGDVLLDEAGYTYREDGIDGLLSKGMKAEIADVDFFMFNQEFPFGEGGTPVENKQYTYEVKPSYVSAFTDMGVDLVSLANNHTLDYGAQDLTQTFQTLTDAGIKYIGAGNTEDEATGWQTFNLGGANVAFLSGTRVLPTMDWSIESTQPGISSCYDTTTMVKQIKAAKASNDLVVVYMHWGAEKSSKPEEYQREMAHEFINAGADLIVGSHSHVFQGIEYYNGVPIVYCLGNFIFDSSTDSLALLQVKVDANLQLSLRLVPGASSRYKTYVKDDEDAQDALKAMEALSTDITIDENGNVIPPGGSAPAAETEASDEAAEDPEDAEDADSADSEGEDTADEEPLVEEG